MTVWDWQCLIRASRLSAMARLIAHTLALRMDWETLECWPAMATIHREAGCSESTAHKAIRELKSSGYLEVVYRGSRGKNLTNLYRAIRPSWTK